jgi:DNA replication protein DnaC
MTDTLSLKLQFCKLYAMREHFERIKKEAEEHAWAYDNFLETLVDEELLCKENKRFGRLFKQARFPLLKTLEHFDFSKAPYLNKKEVMALYDCSFMSNKENLILIGSPGTGKTHISLALGVEACRKGKKVLFYTAAALGNKLVEMQQEKELSDFLDRLRAVDLLIIDELGYVKLSPQTTQLLFQVFSDRYEKGSILISTNLEFSEWADVFNDERMTAAILDRLIHNSRIILFNGESYRFRKHKEDMKPHRKSEEGKDQA